MRLFVALLIFTAGLLGQSRGLLICVSDQAPDAVRSAAQSVLAKVAQHPLLTVLARDHAPSSLTSSEDLASGAAERRAYNHLVVIGLANDPMIAASDPHEARPETGGMYIFGFGHLSGDIGYVESDRNPFLHGAAIAKSPFETEVIRITGATVDGLRLGVSAFLRGDLINGVVAAAGWKHGTSNLLDHDPLPPDFQPPEPGSPPSAEYRLVGWTQASEDEYRGVLADTGVAPREIWRAKYYRDDVWDGAGAARAFLQYASGLHRRAYGNTLWMARFASAAEASVQAPKIAGAANLQPIGDRWAGKQPAYAGGGYAGDAESAGPLVLWQQGEWLLMRSF